MAIDPCLVADIQKAERLELEAYPDTNGFWTIGWGHKLPVRAAGWKGLVWTRERADMQLVADILEAGHGALVLPEWIYCDTRARRNALVELVFNMGATKWQTFIKTRTGLRLQNWKTVSDELKASAWYQQVGSRRGDRLRDYFLTGCYPPSVVASSSYASSSSAWPHGSAPGGTSLAAIG